MSRKHKNQQGYKPVEIQELQKEISETPYKNPYTIVGDAKPSRTGFSLAMHIRCSDGKIHDYTISRADLNRIFLWDYEDGDLIPASIREYHNKQE